MAKKIKELTDVLLDEKFENVKDKWRAELDAANLALSNECYEQAWEHFYKLYELKDSSIPNLMYYKGEGAYGLCRIMQEIPDTHEMVNNFMETDPDLVRKNKVRYVSNDYARKYIGRKYLLYAADDCGFYPAMSEYALNCVGKGPKKSFVFDYNDRDAQTGYQWGTRLINSHEKTYRAVGYMVHAIYHFARYRKSKDLEEGRLFCDDVISARDLVGDKNQYVVYFYAHMCADPKFQFYDGGKHYDVQKGYDLFCKVLEIATDPDLIASATNIKSTLETKYSKKIGK